MRAIPGRSAELDQRLVGVPRLGRPDELARVSTAEGDFPLDGRGTGSEGGRGARPAGSDGPSATTTYGTFIRCPTIIPPMPTAWSSSLTSTTVMVLASRVVPFSATPVIYALSSI